MKLRADVCWVARHVQVPIYAIKVGGRSVWTVDVRTGLPQRFPLSAQMLARTGTGEQDCVYKPLLSKLPSQRIATLSKLISLCPRVAILEPANVHSPGRALRTSSETISRTVNVRSTGSPLQGARSRQTR